MPAATVDTARGSDVWGFGQMMTLRQIEVIRAVMVTGTIGGAAKLLNVSAPGISRLVKYTEKSLGIRFFQRQKAISRRPKHRTSLNRSTVSTKRSMISPRSSPKSD